MKSFCNLMSWFFKIRSPTRWPIFSGWSAKWLWVSSPVHLFLEALPTFAELTQGPPSCAEDRAIFLGTPIPFLRVCPGCCLLEDSFMFPASFHYWGTCSGGCGTIFLFFWGVFGWFCWSPGAVTVGKNHLCGKEGEICTVFLMAVGVFGALKSVPRMSPVSKKHGNPH